MKLLVSLLGVATLAFSVGAVATAEQGCSAATTAAVISDVPILAGVVCRLAADQTTAEPGWEIDLCQAIDPTTGKAAGPTFTVKHPKAQALRVQP